MLSDTLEAIELFKSLVLGEIFDLCEDNEDLQSSLIEAVKEVEKTVIETYRASRQTPLK